MCWFFSVVICCIGVVWSDINCFNAKSCIGQSLNDAGWSFLDGYKAAFGPNTSLSSGEISCRGSFSCHSMAFIKANTGLLRCTASYSCGNTIIENTATHIHCRAYNACSFSNITTSTWVYCNGYHSCLHAYIYGATNVYSEGRMSLYRATIDSINTVSDTLNLYLSGKLTAYSATLTCRAGHTCNIYCQSADGCSMLYMDCIGTCNVVLTSVFAIEPTQNRTQFDINYNIPIDTLFESQPMFPNNDANCSNGLWTFDDYNERNGSNIVVSDNTDPICCRGSYSCSNLAQIEYQTQLLICSGFYSCLGSIISSNRGTVLCSGNRGCYMAFVSSLDYVYCFARQGCYISTITQSRYIICDGFESCRSADITSGGIDVSVYLFGKQSGRNLVLRCGATDTCNLYCSGFQSCSGTRVYCDGVCNMECDATDSLCAQVFTSKPSMSPTLYPSLNPTQTPTDYPSTATEMPSIFPTLYPSLNPTQAQTPTEYPSLHPTQTPTLYPSFNPTEYPFTSTALSSTFETTAISVIAAVPYTWFSPENLIVVSVVCGCIALLGVITVILCRRTSAAQTAETHQEMTQMSAQSSIRNGVVADTDTGAEYKDDAAETKAFEHIMDDGAMEGQKDKELVRIWLSATVGLSQYYDIFITNGYETLEFISAIKDKNELIEIGVMMAGHRTQIMRQINELNVSQQGNDVLEESDHENDDLWNNEHAPIDTEGAKETEGVNGTEE